MIEIRVFPKGDGMVLSAEGHAGMAPRGQDIVCAGVSALLFGFAAYLESLTPCGEERTAHLACVEGDGVLRLSTHGLGGEELRGWAVVAAGLRLIEEAYPACVRLLDGYSSARRHEHEMEVKSERYA